MEQNDRRFQIETNPTKELMKEGYRAVIFHSWRPAVYGVMAALCLWQTGRYFYLAFYWNSQGWEEAFSTYLPYGLYFLLLTGVMIGMFLTMPALSARRYMKQVAAIHGDVNALSVIHRFDEEGIYIHSSIGTDIHTAYDQIVSVWETAHGIVLRRKMSMFEMLDKSRLEGGTLEDFRAFLQEKMPGAKFHWKQ